MHHLMYKLYHITVVLSIHEGGYFMVIMLVILAYANGYTIPTIGWVFFALYCAFNAVAAIAKAISS